MKKAKTGTRSDNSATTEAILEALKELKVAVKEDLKVVLRKEFEFIEEITVKIQEMNKTFDGVTPEVKQEENAEEVKTENANEVQPLQEENAETDELLRELEDKMDELEQRGRLNEVIVTGLKITHQTRSVKKQVAEFLAGRGIDVDFKHVEVCHLIPRRAESGPRAVVLRFANGNHKTALLKQSSKLRGSDVYVNENLTRKNADIARRARRLKKGGKIRDTWTANCRIYIKTNGSAAEDVKTVRVRSEDELDKYDK